MKLTGFINEVFSYDLPGGTDYWKYIVRNTAERTLLSHSQTKPVEAFMWYMYTLSKTNNHCGFGVVGSS